ncbi:CbxX/CfxQ [Fusarium oxysporum f. sp. vasinfectum]|nr:CbxX/CfxQ [Fusarium oxysporum f. sp. vasinfectum]
MKLELTLEQLPEVTQPLPEHKTDQSGQSQDAHEDNLPGNTEHEKSANAEEHQDEKATTEDEKSEEVGNDDVADTTKEEELKWTELLLDDDYDFETAIDKSPSQQEWSRQKREENQQNVYLDRIMSMAGHEQVKAHFLAVKEKVDTAKRWNRSIKDWTFDLLIHGRNETGKNMIAQIYTEFLHSIGVVDKKKFAVENKWYKDKITPEVSILFFWDADRIDRESEVDDILEAKKGLNSRTVLILSFRKLDPDTQKALDTSSESRRRFSNIIRLENYGESEIFELLTRLCKSKPEFGDGSTTLLRTLSRKIAGRALAEGRAFTNAHAVAEEFDKVCERYQKRKEAGCMAWAKTHSPDDGETFGPEHFKDGISLEDEDIEHIIDLAEVNYQNQLHGLKPLEPIDFDPDFNRSKRADENRNALFEDFVGFEHITDRFRKYQKMANGMRRYGLDPKPHIPWAFVFKGPPGTGKTGSTARKVGKLFYDIGFLSSDEVVTCSVTNLTGEFLGHTGPKVINQFKLGLGKVLFIDEAYRLIGDSFHKEAIGELVDVMTKPRYAHNMVDILAGYSNEMEELLMVNPGLRSRFPTVLEFPQMAPEECLKLLDKLLSKLNISLSISTTGEHKAAVLDVLKQLIDSKGWASGRDVKTLSQAIIELVFTKAGEAEEISGSEGLCVSYKELMDYLEAIIEALCPILDQIQDNTRSASISIGVLHHGEVIFTRSRFTAVCCGIPVDEGELNWTEPIRSYIPFTNTVDPVVGQRATIQDALSHNRGLAYMDLTWLGVECDSILDKKDLRIVFHYNNCMYAVAGLVIEQQSGRPWYEFLKERILEPLGMHRTVRHRKKLPHGNVAETHVVLDGYSLHRQKPVDTAADDTFMGLAGGVWSNVSDMMKWAKLSSTPCTNSLRSSKRFRPSYHTNPISPPLP